MKDLRIPEGFAAAKVVDIHSGEVAAKGLIVERKNDSEGRDSVMFRVDSEEEQFLINLRFIDGCWKFVHQDPFDPFALCTTNKNYKFQSLHAA